MILSIIIPVYNVEKYVEKCIRSCEIQDIPKEDYEIIVVNDGSTDGSITVVERLAEEYSNITVLSQENGGPSKARNECMRHANGDYYMFVDSDDWIAENCLGKLVALLESENPDVLAICAANVVDGQPVRWQSYSDETPITGREFLKKCATPVVWQAIWKASFLKKHALEFYEGIFHEDAEFTPRAYYLADKVSRTNDIIYYYFKQNSASITRMVNPKRAFDLVEVVCPNLSVFAEGVDDDCKACFYDMEESGINLALSVIRGAEKKEKDRLNAEIACRSYIWADIRKCSYLKYRLEALVMQIFRKHPVEVYEILHLFNSRS